jgi:hypothetical protein
LHTGTIYVFSDNLLGNLGNKLEKKFNQQEMHIGTVPVLVPVYGSFFWKLKNVPVMASTIENEF